MLLSYRSAKVFTLENFPLDCRLSGICTIGSIYKADPFCHLRINSDIHIFLCNTGLCTWLILLVNVNNPFKKSVHTYQQIDSVLIVYVSLFCASILGINIGSMEQHAYLPVMNVHCSLPLLLAMLYVLYIILYCICSQRRCGRDLFSSVV